MSKDCHYGSEIAFSGEAKGNEKGKSYRWIAHANEKHPETIFLNKNNDWFTKNKKFFEFLILKVLIHEPIHNILWDNGLDPNNQYDIVKHRFLNKYKMELEPEERRQFRMSL